MKILLITTSQLNDKSSSWLLLKQMINKISGHKIVIFSTNHFIKTNKEILGREVIYYSLILNNIIIRKIINRTWKKLNLVIDHYYSKILSKKINNIIKGRSIDKIWIYNSPLTILTLHRLLATPIPYHISIFDDIFHNKVLEASYGEILFTKYLNLLQNSESLDVIVPEQRDYYLKNKLINSSQSIGISYGGCFKNSQIDNYKVNDNIKNICITGSIFGIESFVTFCSAIENICAEKSIEIDIYTNANNLTKTLINKHLARFSNFVKLKPFVSEKFIVQTILNYDLAYIQVPFSESYKHKAITSFPSKTHNYLASTVPILLHSPDYAAVSKFLRKNDLCYAINTIKPGEIEVLFQNILNPELRSSIRDNVVNFNNRADKNQHFVDLIKVITK